MTIRKLLASIGLTVGVIPFGISMYYFFEHGLEKIEIYDAGYYLLPWITFSLLTWSGFYLYKTPESLKKLKTPPWIIWSSCGFLGEVVTLWIYGMAWFSKNDASRLWVVHTTFLGVVAFFILISVIWLIPKDRKY